MCSAQPLVNKSSKLKLNGAAQMQKDACGRFGDLIEIVAMRNVRHCTLPLNPGKPTRRVNDSGQLGDGTVDNSSTPSQVVKE
jgi:hypothetical protein